jgi:hypothetical protein
MFMTIRTYQGCSDPGALDRRVQAAIVPKLKAMAGFRSYTTVDLGGGAVASVSAFDTKAHAEAANQTAPGLVAEHLRDLLPSTPSVAFGPVLSTHTA